MRNNKRLFFLFLFISFNVHLNGQDGQSDVQFVLSDLNCSTVLFDIEIKAASPDTEFFVSEQNYRFSFDDEELANPFISKEFTLSGNIFGTPGPLGFTSFAAHNLVGSVDTVVTYNVELNGGDGYYLKADEWTKVGQVGFDFLKDSACIDLIWHPLSVFPSTFVGEIYEGGAGQIRERTQENFYGDYTECISCLPVELVAFSGEERDCQIHLSWETATETNSDYFIVEHSSDATQFYEIGRVDAAGNSLETIYYNFTDKSAGEQTYYRLKQVDIDGSFEYFNVIKIHSTCFEDGGSTILDVYPNPVKGAGDMYIKIYAHTDDIANITIMDVSGRVVSSQSQSIVEGRNLLNLSVGNLSAGAYLVKIEGKDWHSSAKKFIKIK